MLIFLSLAGCSLAGEKNPDEKQTAAEAPVYEKSTSQFQLSEDANPYMIDYAQKGFFYFVMGEGETEESPNGDVEPKTEYQFFYQTYDGTDAVPFCTVADGGVRDFSGFTKDGGNRLAVLLTGGEACILEFDEAGDNCGKAVIDERFNNLEEIIEFLAWPDGGFVIGMADQVYFLDADGQITETLKLEGTVRKFYVADDNELFAVAQKDGMGNGEMCLTKLNIQKGQTEMTRDLQSDIMGLFVFEDGFVSVFGDRVVFFHADREEEEVLIDLNRQGLLASQIQYIFGNREEIKIVSLDREYGGYLFALSQNAVPEEAESSEESEKPLYAPDGRRIIRVAVPQDYLYQIEFHATEYNQTSDRAFVEIERFDGSLETFLGKGNRPDVIMFNDQTEIAAYVQKDALADMLPLFQDQEKYSLDEVIPKAREFLGIENEDAMYAMAGRFWMLLRISDGTEYDPSGRCDAAGYLKWYDKFMTENEIDGVGAIENLLYANIGFFYDEDMAETFFTSDEFKGLMQSYKEVYDQHKGDIDSWAVTVEKGQKAQQIAIGPRWRGGYGHSPDVKIEGTPGINGENHVYMKLDHPMGIMSTSDCRGEAFDFIMYYSSLAELAIVGDVAAYGKSGTTPAIFSVYERVMNEQIYESERPYFISDGVEYFFTDEQNDHLKDLINSAVSSSKAQNDIYAMLMEEMGAYLEGGKELDSVCEILQSRAELYLKEQK